MSSLSEVGIEIEIPLIRSIRVFIFYSCSPIDTGRDLDRVVVALASFIHVPYDYELFTAAFYWPPHRRSSSRPGPPQPFLLPLLYFTLTFNFNVFVRISFKIYVEFVEFELHTK